MKKSLIAVAALTAIVLAGCAKPQKAWITDIDEAKAASHKQKKDLLIAFTGSDWNDPSKELIAKVFTPEFFKKASKGYVLCNIDIVQDESLLDSKILNKNYKTSTEYGVQGLPLFVLQTPADDVYASTVPQDGEQTSDKLLSYLATFKDSRKKIVDMKKAIDSSKGAERAKAIDKFIETVDPSRRESYGDLMRQVPDLDSDGAAGLKGKYQLQIAYLDAIGLYQQSKMVEAGDLFLKLAEEGSLSAAQTQEAYYMGAYMNAMAGTVEQEKILGWLQKAIDADPQNEGTGQIKTTIEQLKATPAKKAN
jgi:hypothetical protein